ncbi:E3 ubiquitin-protein ligase RNF14-like [Clarias gariepinus]
MSEDQEAQTDELLALASIYDEEFRRAEFSREGEIHLCLELPRDFKLLVKGDKCVEYSVSFLPPLVLSFELPVDYPSSSAPMFMLSSKWLSRLQLTSLCKRLDDLWQENKGSVVLFTWIEFLKDEALDFLGLQSPLEMASISTKHSQLESCRTDGATNRAESAGVEKKKPVELDPRAVLESHMDLLCQLLDFDEAQTQKFFDSKVFCCGICFSEKPGSSCTLFKGCQHVYCKACIKEFFQIQIRDGQVQCLTCPEPKCASVAAPSQVKLLVGEDEFARYDRLLLQNTLDLMSDVMYCPRRSCGSAVVLEPDSTMGLCPGCRYAFCTLCKHAYHGLFHCLPSSQELHDLHGEYMAASKDRKRFMELRFGKQAMRRVVEETCSKKWLKKNSKSCPCCGCHIQKIEGCNKMTCSTCGQYFCWICRTPLSRTNPYSHYRNPKLPCYNKCFARALRSLESHESRCIPGDRRGTRDGVTPPFSRPLFRSRSLPFHFHSVHSGAFRECVEEACSPASGEMEVATSERSSKEDKEYEELLKVITRAVERLHIDWPQEQAFPKRSKLDDKFLSGGQELEPQRRSLPFFDDLHNELTHSWSKPYSFRIFVPSTSFMRMLLMQKHVVTW